MRIFRIIAVIIILGAAYFGYRYVTDKKEAEIHQEYQKYALVISEVSIAAELYRNHPDSFITVRDSILISHNLTLDDIKDFQSGLSGDNTEWSRVWSLVTGLTDSLVNERMTPSPKDSLTDSSEIEDDSVIVPGD